jgi:hypothetical protein
VFPVPLPRRLNAPHPSADRNRTALSLAYKVLKKQEVIAIAANKVCRPLPVPRRCRGQHLLAAAVMLTAVAPVVVADMVVKSDINFYLYDFQKNISDDRWTGSGLAGLCLGTRGASFFLT